MPSTHILKHNNTGFTLLELLMVVTIMSAVAWMSLGAVNNNMDQVRFGDTQNRLESIKRAIIGDSSRTINGQPEIRGYVADMGNLPANLNALILKDYCSDPQYTTQTDCESNSETWTVQGEYCSNHTSLTESTCTSAGEDWITEYSYDDEYGLWTGWNGPYLTAKELVGYAKFRDGWGNKSTPATNDFGWKVDTSTDDFIIQSYGKEGDSSGTDDYEADYPPTASKILINENDYAVTVTTDGNSSITAGDGIGSITVDFGTPEPCWGCWDTNASPAAYISAVTSPPGIFNRKACEATSGQYWRPKLGVNDEGTCVGDTVSTGAPYTVVDGTWLQTTATPEKICLRLTYRDDGKILPVDSVDSTINSAAESTFTWNGSRQQLDFVFPDNTKLPMGILAYNLYEYDTTVTPNVCSETKLFQPENTSWSTLTIVPGTSTTPLNWKLQ